MSRPSKPPPRPSLTSLPAITDSLELIIFIDERLKANRLDEVNALLRVLDPKVLLPSVTLAVLNSVYPKRAELSEHAGFIERAEMAMSAKLGAERALRLLASRR